MTQNTQVKICGIKTPDAMTAALEGGAAFVGLVFYPASPRFVEIEVAAYLASYVPAHIKVVGLFVNPDDTQLQTVLSRVRLDIIQLHGQETPDRVSEIRKKFNKPVMKVLSIAQAEDLGDLPLYEAVSDWILFDARGTTLPGGNGRVFDWSLLKDVRPKKPWMLAGGLTPDNIREAIALVRPDAVDVSSGVESAPGEKDPVKIKSFLKLALSADKS